MTIDTIPMRNTTRSLLQVTRTDVLLLPPDPGGGQTDDGGLTVHSNGGNDTDVSDHLATRHIRAIVLNIIIV